MKKLLLIPASLFFLFPSFTFSQKKIEQSKSELNSSKSSNNSSNSSGNSSRNSSDGDEDVSLFANIAFGVFKYGIIGDYRFERHLDSPLTPYPFYNNESGNYGFPGQEIFENNSRLDLENHFLYSDNNLFGNHLKAKFRPFQYFYVQGDYREIFEKTKLTAETDHLSLFHLNFCYDRIRFEKFNLGWNIGASYVGNEVRKAGFSYGLSTDIFFHKRLTFSAAAKWSQINGYPVNTYEFQTKYHKKKYFLALGYEHLKIASPKYNFITLGGGIYF